MRAGGCAGASQRATPGVAAPIDWTNAVGLSGTQAGLRELERLPAALRAAGPEASPGCGCGHESPRTRASAKVAAAGSGTDGEQEAAAINSISDMTTAELYQRWLDGRAEWLFDNPSLWPGVGGGSRGWEIPVGSEWGSSCLAAGRLDLPSIGASRTLADVGSTGGPPLSLSCRDPDLFTVLETAWSMLQDNADLVGPVCEFVFGLDGSCIVKELGLGMWGTLVYCTDASSDGWGFINKSNPCPGIAYASTGRGVGFCSTRGLVEEYARVFRDGTDDERLCVLVDVAATLFHEFTHVCLLNSSDGDADEPCRTSYLAENTLKWLLLRRYPGALNPTCCGSKYASPVDSGLPDPGLFMSDESTMMAEGGEYACA